MRRFTKKNNSKKLLILIILFACFISIIPIMGFVVFSPKEKIFSVKYVKGYGENYIQKYSKGEELNFPEPPTRFGYKFAGWFTKLIEINTLVNEDLSEEFVAINDVYIVLYAGWTK